MKSCFFQFLTENDQLELLGPSDSEDIFTFNANEIYITDPQERGFDENFEEDTSFNDYEGFGSDDLFFPQKTSRRFSNYDKVCYQQARDIAGLTNSQKHFHNLIILGFR